MMTTKMKFIALSSITWSCWHTVCNNVQPRDKFSHNHSQQQRRIDPPDFTSGQFLTLQLADNSFHRVLIRIKSKLQHVTGEDIIKRPGLRYKWQNEAKRNRSKVGGKSTYRIKMWTVSLSSICLSWTSSFSCRIRVHVLRARSHHIGQLVQDAKIYKLKRKNNHQFQLTNHATKILFSRNKDQSNYDK